MRLSDFIARARDLERHVCAGDEERALASLDAIEASFGTSFWVIETRFVLLQWHRGLEVQKRLLSSIRNALPKNDLVSFYAHHISRRNEDSTTPIRFMNNFKALTGAWNDNTGLAEYLNFKLTYDIPQSDAIITHVLRHETNSPIIDQYETFMRLAQGVIVQGSGSARDQFVAELIRLQQYISDPRITAMLFLVGAVSQASGLGFASFEVDDLIHEGRLEEAYEAAAMQLHQEPDQPWLWQKLAELSLMLERDEPEDASLSSHIRRLMRQLLASDNSGEEAFISLLKIGINFGLRSFATSVVWFAWKELVAEPWLLKTMGRAAFVNAAKLHAELICTLPISVRSAFLAAAATANGMGPSLFAEAHKSGLDVDRPQSASGISHASMIEVEIDRRLAAEQFEAVLELSLPLAETTDFLRRRWAARKAAHSLLKLGRQPELTRFIVGQVMAYPGLRRVLPIADCLNAIDKKTLKSMKGEIALPIIYNFAVESGEDGFHDLRAYAYEDFLLARDMTRPSQLRDQAGDFDRRELTYYLRYLCVPNIMQASSEFQGTSPDHS